MEIKDSNIEDQDQWIQQYKNIGGFDMNRNDLNNMQQEDDKEIKELQAYQDEFRLQQEEKERLKNLPKCEMHPLTPSKNCRQCRKIQQQIKESQEQFSDNKKDEEQQMELMELPYRQDKNDKMIKIWQDIDNVQLNSRLKNNIIHCNYFRNLYVIRTYHEVIEEIAKTCSHAEPWAVGGTAVPSSLFCCLYKFMLMKLTMKQIRGLCDTRTNPYVRCIGFLYIRYCSEPQFLWSWMKKYLLDDEEFQVLSEGYSTTIGEYVEKLLIDQEYYKTRLPRIPNKLELKLKVKLILTQEKRQRKIENLKNLQQFQYGVIVRAISREDEDWHEGVVESVEGKLVLVRFFQPIQSQQENQEENALQNSNNEEFSSLAQLDQNFKQNQFQGCNEYVNFAEIEVIQDKKYIKMISEKYLDKHKVDQLKQDQNANNKSNNQENNKNKIEQEIDTKFKQDQKRDDKKKNKDEKSSKNKKKKSEKNTKKKKKNEKKPSKHKQSKKNNKKKHSRSKSSRSSSSSSSSKNSSSSSRSNSNSSKSIQKKKKKNNYKKSNSRSRSRSRSFSKPKAKEQDFNPLETIKEREKKLMEEIKKRNQDRAQAGERTDFSRLSNNYRQTLSSATLLTKPDFGAPKNEQFVEVIIHSVQEEREKQLKEQIKQQISKEVLISQEQIKQKYGDASTSKGNLKNKIGEDYL